MAMELEQTTCLGCRYNRAGRCQDRAVYGKDGGDLLTDDGPRLCYELPRHKQRALPWTSWTRKARRDKN
jgi:hypothetical protein